METRHRRAKREGVATVLNFSDATILCIGDVMLDRFVYGTVERLSPEAPVPVLRQRDTKLMLGGAGNVARNIAALGGNAILVGVIGNDSAGIDVQNLIEDDPNIVGQLAISPSRVTTTKSRYIAEHQQLLRVDEEDVGRDTDAEAESAVIEKIWNSCDEADAIILSDYGRSVLSRKVIETVINRARVRGIPVYVDPKGEDFTRYRGATCITPNLAELALATRMPVATDDEVVAAATKIVNDIGANVLVTRSGKGMLLVETNRAVSIEPTKAQEVYDVTGAGDTAIVVLALASSVGHSLPQAMHIANVAAGIVVGKLGTATVGFDELTRALTPRGGTKVYDSSEITRLALEWKNRGLAVRLASGYFDILTIGHVKMLTDLRAKCDRLIVALTEFKGVNTLSDRAKVVGSLGMVDAVTILDESALKNLADLI